MTFFSKIGNRGRYAYENVTVWKVKAVKCMFARCRDGREPTGFYTILNCNRKATVKKERPAV